MREVDADVRNKRRPGLDVSDALARLPSISVGAG